MIRGTGDRVVGGHARARPAGEQGRAPPVVRLGRFTLDPACSGVARTGPYPVRPQGTLRQYALTVRPSPVPVNACNTYAVLSTPVICGVHLMAMRSTRVAGRHGVAPGNPDRRARKGRRWVRGRWRGGLVRCYARCATVSPTLPLNAHLQVTGVPRQHVQALQMVGMRYLAFRPK